MANVAAVDTAVSLKCTCMPCGRYHITKKSHRVNAQCDFVQLLFLCVLFWFLYFLACVLAFGHTRNLRVHAYSIAHVALLDAHNVVADVIRREERVRKIADECRPVFAVQSFCNCCRRDPTECSVRADCVDFWNAQEFDRLVPGLYVTRPFNGTDAIASVVTYVTSSKLSYHEKNVLSFGK